MSMKSRRYRIMIEVDTMVPLQEFGKEMVELVAKMKWQVASFSTEELTGSLDEARKAWTKKRE